VAGPAGIGWRVVMRWFGESWGAQACDPQRWSPTPVGHGCDLDIGGSGQSVEANDAGVLIPGDGGVAAVHLQCWLRIVVGPCLAHGLLGCDGAGGTPARGVSSGGRGVRGSDR
jgi:hypothetical protein